MQEILKICENCKLFNPFPQTTTENVVIHKKAPKLISAGRRNCTNKDVAWENSRCVTNEFVEKP